MLVYMIDQELNPTGTGLGSDRQNDKQVPVCPECTIVLGRIRRSRRMLYDTKLEISRDIFLSYALALVQNAKISCETPASYITCPRVCHLFVLAVPH